MKEADMEVAGAPLALLIWLVPENELWLVQSLELQLSAAHTCMYVYCSY